MTEVTDYFVLADAKEMFDPREQESIEYELFREHGFDEPDAIVIHGGPSDREEQQRYDAFSDIHDRSRNRPTIYHSGYADRLQDDGIQDTLPTDVTSTRDEIQTLNDNISPGDTVITVTSDYHVPRTEKLMDDILDESVDYLVAGAEWNENEDEYAFKWYRELAAETLPQSVKDVGKLLLP